MGALGAFHCVGMCGPIALSLPVVKMNNQSRFISSLLYNLGRIVTYSFLGLVFGLIGNSFGFFGYQQALSIALGVLIVLIVILPVQKMGHQNFLTAWFAKLRSWLGDLFAKKNYRSVFFIGLLNGLLPCGLVYLAIAGAVSTASIYKSVLFMAGFGLGNLPVMWSLAFWGGFINLNIRNRIKKLYPYLMLVMATLLIIRGLGLNIPYVSPALENHSSNMQAISCHN